jgi:trehalose/maltose transport system substrate-binding protein
MPRQSIGLAVDDSPARFSRSALRPPRPWLLAGFCILLLCVGQGCQRSAPQAPPVTVTMLEQYWLDKEIQARHTQELHQFTEETGIHVEVLPAPETAVDQLAMWQTLLERGAKVPDVYAVDVIWPGILADNLLDLKAYVPAQEIAAYFPELIANNTVNGKLVALPYDVTTGLLYYRTDLLRRYGYRAPPASWDEIEKMALRIQAGERTRGDKNFWGFVWQGAPSEALTCNALEWQVSQGGGPIVENGTITVNNPQTIRAWERAARWVGSISPPGVVAYREWDALNIWQSGEAAFMRNWPGAFIASHAQGSPIKDKFDVSPLPAGRAGNAATLGGHSYGVSRHSLHPREAALLVRYLTRRDVQLRRSRTRSEPPTLPEMYQDPEVLAANPYFANFLQAYRKGVVQRPSSVTGKKYPDVSHAYFEAVHEVLTGKKSAPKAAAELQDQLVQITGFRAPVPGAHSREPAGKQAGVVSRDKHFQE